MMMMTSIYDININTLQGEPLDMSQFKGKYLLIVNVASECGYTKQYAELQDLYETHGDRVTILGVPCNDFGGQEPGSAEEIATFCSANFGVTFPMTQKVGIKKDTHPLYTYLTSKISNGLDDFEVRWNFHKFLVSPEGKLIAAYPSGTSPLDEALLNAIGI